MPSYLLLAVINGQAHHQNFTNLNDALGLFYILNDPSCVKSVVILDLHKDKTVATYDGCFDISWTDRQLIG